jgi:hypothetical protein
MGRVCSGMLGRFRLEERLIRNRRVLGPDGDAGRFA